MSDISDGRAPLVVARMRGDCEIVHFFLLIVLALMASPTGLSIREAALLTCIEYDLDTHFCVFRCISVIRMGTARIVERQSPTVTDQFYSTFWAHHS